MGMPRFGVDEDDEEEEEEYEDDDDDDDDEDTEDAEDAEDADGDDETRDSDAKSMAMFDWDNETSANNFDTTSGTDLPTMPTSTPAAISVLPSAIHQGRGANGPAKDLQENRDYLEGI